MPTLEQARMQFDQFKREALPMMNAVDEAMARIFGKQQTEEERRAELERKEDEFIARKSDLPVSPMAGMCHGRKTGRGV